MPTARRPRFARQAVEMFLAQTWPNAELCILDNALEPSFRTPPTRETHSHAIRYERCRPMPIAGLRNTGNAMARGEILCHWDDDDRQAPGRISDQVTRMLHAGAEITGYHTMLFEDERGRRWRYVGRPGYAIGTSLMYTREFWKRRPFNLPPGKSAGEDNAFIQGVQVLSADAGEMLIARVHRGQTNDTAKAIAECMRDRARGQLSEWEPVA